MIGYKNLACDKVEKYFAGKQPVEQAYRHKIFNQYLEQFINIYIKSFLTSGEFSPVENN